jgi:hypothetical protein
MEVARSDKQRPALDLAVGKAYWRSWRVVRSVRARSNRLERGQRGVGALQWGRVCAMQLRMLSGVEERVELRCCDVPIGENPCTPCGHQRHKSAAADPTRRSKPRSM